MSSCASAVIRRSSVSVSGLPTRVLSLGDPPGALRPGAPLVLVVPGNPGLAGYYERFMLDMRDRLKEVENLSLWSVSHVGHEQVEPGEVEEERGKAEPLPDIRRDLPLDSDPYSIQGQTMHKIQLLKDFVPSDCPVTLVGHSVGCYIAMNVLWHFEQEEKDKKRDLRCQMLFPMMMGMRETPNGFGTHVHANYLGLATYLLVLLLNALLPPSALRWAVRRYLALGRRDLPDCCVVATAALVCNRRSAPCALRLAETELETIRELEEGPFRAAAKRGRFCFGDKDGWCPLDYVNRMRDSAPDLAYLVTDSPHAFVLSSGHTDRVAEKCAEWYREENDR